MDGQSAEAWGVYLSDISTLCDALDMCGAASMGYVFGVPLDGLIPAVLVARRFGMEVVDGLRATMHVERGAQVLVLVGYSDRGDEFVAWHGRPNVKCASLYLSSTKHPRVMPDVHGVMIDGNPIYPYDVGLSPRVRITAGLGDVFESEEE